MRHPTIYKPFRMILISKNKLHSSEQWRKISALLDILMDIILIIHLDLSQIHVFLTNLHRKKI